MAYYVVSRNREVRDRLLPWMRARGEALAAGRWEKLRGIEDQWSEVVLAVAPGGSPTRAWIQAAHGVRTCFPRVGLVLMMDLPDGPEKAIPLPRVDGFLPLDANEIAVLGALDAAVVLGPTRELAGDAYRLPAGPVRGAVLALLHAQRPYRTVDGLARATLASESTLVHGWPETRARLGLRDGVRLKDLLGVTVLTRATAERRRRVVSWNSVAGEMEVATKTIRRWSQQVLSCTLEECDHLKALEVGARIQGWLRPPSS